MKTGVTAAALAASALLVTPAATAQQVSLNDAFAAAADIRGGKAVSHRNRGDFRGHNNRRFNQFGQTRREVRRLKERAIYDCLCQLELDARRYGYKDATFRGTPYVEQIGPKGFIVKGTAKLFDGYDYSRQAYDCKIRRGTVRQASNLYPVTYTSHHSRRNRFGNGRRFNNNGFSFSFGNRW